MEGSDSSLEKLGRFAFRRYNMGMITSLKRVDPERHMDRWYTVTVQPTLLDPAAVICAWGNRRSRYQQLRVLPAASEEEALTRAKEIVKKKLARGYCFDHLQ